MKKIIFLITMAFLAVEAKAQDIFTAADSDKIENVFGSIFGKLGVWNSTSVDPFAELAFLLNSAILILVGLFTTFYILKGVMISAHEGDNGKSMSTGWHIIRFTIAIAMLLPVIDGKYSTANYLVGWTVKQGIGLGYIVANKVVEEETLNQISISSFQSPDVSNLTHNTFLSYVCVLGSKDYFDKYNETWYNSNVILGVDTSNNLNGEVINFGNLNNKEIMKDSCGSVTIPSMPVLTLNREVEEISAIANNNRKETLILVSETRKVAVKALDFLEKSKIQELSREDYLKIQLEIANDLQMISDNYRKNVSDFAYNLVKNDEAIQQMQEAIKKDGFFSLGTMTMRITEIQERTNNALGKVATATGIPPITNKYLREAMSDKYLFLTDIALVSNSPFSFGIAQIDGNNESSWWESIKGTFTDPSILLKRMVSSAQPIFYDSNTGLLGNVQSFGSFALFLSATLTGTMGTLMATAGNLPGIGLFLQSIFEFIIPPMAFFGAFALYILPMIPVYIWFGAIISYLLSCIGAIIIASFIPATMLLGGQDVMGQATNAFKQILSMLFKPALMCISYAIALVMLNVVGQLIMPNFISIWNLAQDGSNVIVYFVSIIFMLVSMVLFSSFLVSQIFMITMKLPDTLISWIGGAHGFAIGATASDFSSSGASMGASIAGGVVGGALASASKNNDSNSKNKLEKMSDRALPKTANESLGTSPKSSSNSENSLSSFKEGSNDNNEESSLSEIQENSGNEEGSIDGGEKKNINNSDKKSIASPSGKPNTKNKYSGGSRDLPKTDYMKQIERMKLSKFENKDFENPSNNYLKFNGEFDQMKEKGVSNAEAAHFAFDSTISLKYGAGTGKLIYELGGKSYMSKEAVDALGVVDDVKDKFKDNKEGYKDTINTALKELDKGGSKSVSNYFSSIDINNKKDSE